MHDSFRHGQDREDRESYPSIGSPEEPAYCPGTETCTQEIKGRRG